MISAPYGAQIKDSISINPQSGANTNTVDVHIVVVQVAAVADVQRIILTVARRTKPPIAMMLSINMCAIPYSEICGVTFSVIIIFKKVLCLFIA